MQASPCLPASSLKIHSTETEASSELNQTAEEPSHAVTWGFGKMGPFRVSMRHVRDIDACLSALDASASLLVRLSAVQSSRRSRVLAFLTRSICPGPLKASGRFPKGPPKGCASAHFDFCRRPLRILMEAYNQVAQPQDKSRHIGSVAETAIGGGGHKWICLGLCWLAGTWQ